MGKLNCWQCETCKRKIFDEFSKEWFHISEMKIKKGEFSERYNGNYDMFKDLTFCSIECLKKWLENHFGINPSIKPPIKEED